MNNYEILQASGNLDIIKIYNNGSSEVIFSDHNVITSGLGVSLATIFVGSGTSNIKDHQIRWFQVGSGTSVSYNSTQNALVSPLAIGDYGNTLSKENHERANAAGGFGAKEAFVWIPQTALRKTSSTSVTYLLNLDKDSCNGASIKEIGLFVHSPFRRFTGSGVVRSVMAAYRQFSEIAKTDEFSLLFRWTLSF